jgi:hypothetical protein
VISINPLLTLSLLLNATGTLISVSGAVANALGKYKMAFTLWIISNAILLLLFVGVAQEWWILNSGAWFQVGLYAIFCVTSTSGYWRERNSQT